MVYFVVAGEAEGCEVFEVVDFFVDVGVGFVVGVEEVG